MLLHDVILTSHWRHSGYGAKKLMKEFPQKGWSISAWTVMQRRVYQRQIHSVDELKRQLIDVWSVMNSRFLTRLLTSGEEEFEHVSVLKEDTSSTACELTMLILSISVTFSVTCLTVASLITKSCQQRWPIGLHSYSFTFTIHKQIWGLVVDFRIYLVAVNFCLQQWKNIKIRLYLPKLPLYCSGNTLDSINIYITNNDLR